MQIVELCRLENEELNNLTFRISIPLREFVRMCLAVMLPKMVVIFGSSVKTRHREDSDIDLCIITEKRIGIADDLKLERLTEKIEKRFKKIIQLHLFTEQEFEKLRKSKDLLVTEIIKDGIVVL